MRFRVRESVLRKLVSYYDTVIAAKTSSHMEFWPISYTIFLKWGYEKLI